MAVSANFISYVVDQLTALGPVRSRRMFGGIGLYCGERFFGLIDDDVLYFKVDDSNRNDYVSRGCEAFQPFEGAVSMNYYRVPEDVLEDTDEACAWARKSVTIATAAAPKKKQAKKKVAKSARSKATVSKSSTRSKHPSVRRAK